MKMTLLKVSATLAMIAGLAINANAAKKEAKYSVDTTASKVEWTGKKVTGAHNGTINVKSGSVMIDGKKIVGGEFVIDMTTIKDVDLTDAEYNKKLIGHLSSDDFFSIQKFGEAKLVVKTVKETAPGKAEITGDLTIKGKTNPITFPAEVKWEGDKVMASGKMMIDRTKYDIKYNSGKFFQNLGDKLINDEFELSFNLSAKK